MKQVDPKADVRRTVALGDDVGSATEGRNLVRPSVVLRNVVETSLCFPARDSLKYSVVFADDIYRV